MFTKGRAAVVSSVLLLAIALSLCVTVAAPAAPKVDGAISGFVVDPTGRGVQGVKVSVCEPHYIGSEILTWTPTFSRLTNSSGKYTISVPAGTYRVWFEPADLKTYCMEAYPNAAIPDLGGDVQVKVGRTTGRISVALDGSPGWFYGQVYDAVSHAPLPGIEVRLAYQAPAIINTILLGARTDSEGGYCLGGLKPFSSWGIWANQTPPPWLEWPYDPNYELYEYWPGPTQSGVGYRIDVPLTPVIP